MKYKCNICNIYTYDSQIGDEKLNIKPETNPADFPDDWRCPICHADKTHQLPINGVASSITEELSKEKEKKDITYFRDRSREKLAGICAVNKVCDGNPDRLCQGQKYGRAIGLGGAGQGKTFDANFRSLEKYRFKTKVVKTHHEPEMQAEIFSQKIKMPVLVSSISGVKISMNDTTSELDFQREMMAGAKLFGTIGMSGNTVDHPNHPGLDVLQKKGAEGIIVFKPQEQIKLLELFQKAEEVGAIAIGVDLDGCGSMNWALRGKPVFRKSSQKLTELVQSTSKPVFFKGIMNLEDAEAVARSGAVAMVVSNHGGRVLDYGQGVGEVLPEISKRFRDQITIIADGAVRTGFDVLKVLALGADFVSIGRPMARMALGGGAVAIDQYLQYVQKELRGAMLMTGCDNLKEVTHKILVS